MLHTRLVPLLTLGSLTAALALALPNRAEACGGTFCDTGPNAMPVDQTGENILFVIDGEYVEAHIQIQYDPNTDAAKFAWVIPVTALPEFSVGSQLLFDNMLGGSVPTYGFNTSQEICGDNNNNNGSGSGLSGGDPSGDSAGASGGDDEGEPPGPDVLYKGTVGAFDIVVLQDTDVASLMKWLGDNGYQQDPKAEPIFDEYLKEGHLFVAFKLTNDAEVAEIHPVVLRYKGDESCVPIRLTRIAAQDDMDIRAFFLGDARTVPTNYRHVLVNPLKLDWPNFASNYKAVITLAVDAFGADGRAFVTEYAGAGQRGRQLDDLQPVLGAQLQRPTSAFDPSCRSWMSSTPSRPRGWRCSATSTSSSAPGTTRWCSRCCPSFCRRRSGSRRSTSTSTCPRTRRRSI
jgi:hypothetical protein